MRKALLFIGIALLLEVLSGVFTLLIYILNASDMMALSCFIDLISLGSFLLLIIGFIMIATKKKILGKDGRFFWYAIGALAVFIVCFLFSVIIMLMTMFSLDPRYYTISLIGLGIVSALFGKLIIFFLIFPLLSSVMKKKVAYSFILVVLLAIVVQPFIFMELRGMEDSFNDEFGDRTIPDDEEENMELSTEVQNWIINSTSAPEFQNMVVYNSFSFIPLAYAAMLIFNYARTRKARPCVDAGSAYPPPGSGKKDDVIKGVPGKCRFCGTVLVPGVEFCPSCGAYLKE